MTDPTAPDFTRTEERRLALAQEIVAALRFFERIAPELAQHAETIAAFRRFDEFARTSDVIAAFLRMTTANVGTIREQLGGIAAGLLRSEPGSAAPGSTVTT